MRPAARRWIPKAAQGRRTGKRGARPLEPFSASRCGGRGAGGHSQEGEVMLFLRVLFGFRGRFRDWGPHAIDLVAGRSPPRARRPSSASTRGKAGMPSQQLPRTCFGVTTARGGTVICFGGCWKETGANFLPDPLPFLPTADRGQFPPRPPPFLSTAPPVALYHNTRN